MPNKSFQMAGYSVVVFFVFNLCETNNILPQGIDFLGDARPE